ncbi:hypothetical protein ACFVWY_10790 [Streptomyces sp. NPDC058195]|uniref:hypothetical protein n=1 Tax=Streptomyces sp. NPDC058195 TaxID=3346375 RepID=UPI0036E0AB25
MQKHQLRTAFTWCATTALAVAISLPASASTAAPARPSVAASTASHSTARVVAIDCFSNTQVRPGDFLLACGDGNNRLTDIHWSHWGSSSAIGTALDVVNDCQPYCAAGKFHSYPVIVRLDRPEPTRAHPDVQQFTRIKLVYTDAVPDHTGRVMTQELWD